jgi:uncharacterized RDD family membrane protein YckC
MGIAEPVAPTLARRLVCNLYETLLLLAYVFLVSLPVVMWAGNLTSGPARHLFQAYLVVMVGLYFVTFWRKGQTLAMKTWRIRIEAEQGGAAARRQLWLRYLYACLNVVLGGVGWWSALFHPQRQFLQDRLAGTRLVRC